VGYDLEFTNKALQQLNDVPARYYRRIVALIDAILKDPYGQKSKQMNDPLAHYRRVRLNGWRVVYNVDEVEKLITVVKIGEKAGTGTEFYEDLE
jgi:mRNA-degrading endonuclease RelE of RelBE toxin-antitoxin system